MMRVRIEPTFRERDRDELTRLLRDYQREVGGCTCFKEFEAELAGLPGDYAPPRGVLLLARKVLDGALVGCVGLCAEAGGAVAEMRRLYVTPELRRSGLGRKLAEGALDQARARGYRRVRLETLPSMTAAHALYRSLGFHEIPPDEDCKDPVHRFEKDLRLWP
jgi:ribosomal protein S18 acetylase RimI-like enzyme